MDLHLKFLSLNVRGLRDSSKRRELFHWLKHYHDGGKSIIFLQESHTIESDQSKWEKEWGSKVIISNYKTSSRGVAILLPMKINFTIDKIASSDDGRKIVITISYKDKNYTLMNIYAPTQDLEKEQIIFYKELETDVE